MDQMQECIDELYAISSETGEGLKKLIRLQEDVAKSQCDLQRSRASFNLETQKSTETIKVCAVALEKTVKDLEEREKNRFAKTLKFTGTIFAILLCGGVLLFFLSQQIGKKTAKYWHTKELLQQTPVMLKVKEKYYVKIVPGTEREVKDKKTKKTLGLFAEIHTDW